MAVLDTGVDLDHSDLNVVHGKNCVGSGAADDSGLTPAQVIAKVRSQASAHSTAQQGYGFKGDPLHPVSGRSYGYLAWASTTSAAAGARYHPLAPGRILDTRSGTGAPAAKMGPAVP